MNNIINQLPQSITCKKIQSNIPRKILHHESQELVAIPPKGRLKCFNIYALF